MNKRSRWHWNETILLTIQFARRNEGRKKVDRDWRWGRDKAPIEAWKQSSWVIQSNKKGASGKRSKRNDTKLRELTSLELKSPSLEGTSQVTGRFELVFLVAQNKEYPGLRVLRRYGVTAMYDFDLCRGKKKAGPRTHGGDRPRNRGKGKIHDWPRTHGSDRPRNRGKGKIHGFPRILVEPCTMWRNKVITIHKYMQCALNELRQKKRRWKREERRWK